MKHAFGATLWFLSMAALGAWLAYMAVIDTEPPFRYLSEDQGSKITVTAGGHARTEWQLTKVKKDCPRQIERLYYNRDTGELVTTQDATPLSRVVKKSETELSRSFELPPGLPARVSYQARACFQCNVLQMLFPLCVLSPRLSIDIENPQ